jgi:AcrR family transcriptional regulator
MVSATASVIPGPRPPLTRERIVRAALAVVDADGIEGLTMRRLAAELGAAPMAPYAHLADKRALLEGLRRLLDEAEFEDGLARAESELPALIDYELHWAVAIASRP